MLNWRSIQVRIKNKGQRQSDVPFVDDLICLRHLASQHALTNLICPIILTSRHYPLYLTEMETEGQEV